MRSRSLHTHTCARANENGAPVGDREEALVDLDAQRLKVAQLHVFDGALLERRFAPLEALVIKLIVYAIVRHCAGNQ